MNGPRQARYPELYFYLVVDEVNKTNVGLVSQAHSVERVQDKKPYTEYSSIHWRTGTHAPQ